MVHHKKYEAEEQEMSCGEPNLGYHWAKIPRKHLVRGMAFEMSRCACMRGIRAFVCFFHDIVRLCARAHVCVCVYACLCLCL